MSEFRKITFSDEWANRYWEGASNRFSRYYTYLQRGFNLVNEAKNYFLLLLSTYWTIKLMDWWKNTGYTDIILVAGFVVLAIIGIVILIVVGRWELYRLSQAREFATTINGTIVGFNGYNVAVTNLGIQEEILKNLKEISEKLDKLNYELRSCQKPK